PDEALVAVIGEKLGRGRGRALERDQRFLADGFLFDNQEAFDAACAEAEPALACSAPVRDRANLLEVIDAEIVVPQVEETWTLYDSVFNRNEIVLQAAEKHPNAVVEFKSWLTGDFLTNPQSSEAELAGVRTAIRGTLFVVLVTFVFSFPIGVGAAIYMEEYADHTKWYNKIIQTNISNLAGVPSIIYGMLGLTVFVRLLLPITSGQIFGQVAEGTDPSGRTVISAGLTLGLLILPIIIINAQEAIRAVPGSIRRAGMGLGATKWQTTWAHVLPQALPGILTGTILAMSRAVGETAPLLVVGASTVISRDPTFFSRFTVLPIQIYQWTSRPQAEFQHIAAAAIVVLLVILLTLNASAIFLRNRYSTSS
ncbi:MAG: phosphate ABC transporter permease PstA, partial [Chloroflexota bacterium]